MIIIHTVLVEIIFIHPKLQLMPLNKRDIVFLIVFFSYLIK